MGNVLTKMNKNSELNQSFSAYFSERDVAKIKEWNEEFPNSKQGFQDTVGELKRSFESSKTRSASSRSGDLFKPITQSR